MNLPKRIIWLVQTFVDFVRKENNYVIHEK